MNVSITYGACFWHLHLHVCLTIDLLAFWGVLSIGIELTSSSGTSSCTAACASGSSLDDDVGDSVVVVRLSSLVNFPAWISEVAFRLSMGTTNTVNAKKKEQKIV